MNTKPNGWEEKIIDILIPTTKVSWEDWDGDYDIVKNNLLELLHQSVLSAEERGRKEEEQRWINQPANEHDNKIKEHLLREIMEEMPKKKEPYKYVGISQIDSDFSDFGGKITHKGGKNEFESILSDEDKVFNQALDQVNTLLESKLSTIKRK